MNVEMVQGCPIGLGKGLELLEEWKIQRGLVG